MNYHILYENRTGKIVFVDLKPIPQKSRHIEKVVDFSNIQTKDRRPFPGGTFIEPDIYYSPGQVGLKFSIEGGRDGSVQLGVDDVIELDLNSGDEFSVKIQKWDNFQGKAIEKGGDEFGVLYAGGILSGGNAIESPVGKIKLDQSGKFDFSLKAGMRHKGESRISFLPINCAYSEELRFRIV